MNNDNGPHIHDDTDPIYHEDSTWVCPDCGQEKCSCETCPDCGDLIQDCYCEYQREKESGTRRRRRFDDEEDFADPGGRSSLRAASENNPRIYPCPSCGRKNVLTQADLEHGYQCNRCADRDERGF